ncbi:alpha-(1,3)-fucosyltransferase 7-like [Scleropages formosus]|nr:alpha-(1,3)-fucosyltransferase 7-like [Scleropages formosus]
MDSNISILLWHWPFGHQFELDGDVCWERYGIPRCHLHNQRSQFYYADVVVFHHNELKNGTQKLPLDLCRPPEQKWLWLSLESPASNGILYAYNGLFNWTMSYRRDADIFMPYGELVPKKTTKEYIIPKNKSFLACWVVSNYVTQHRRSKVYESLKKLIKVQVYGNWAKRPLTVKELLPTISRCYFYLAFENSEFKDYITEKLWRNSFQAGAVPVVLGPPRKNYELLVPPNSFIHVDDFESLDSLVDFLKQLASNETQYRSYFKWQEHYEVKVYADWRERLCKICTLYQKPLNKKVYHNLHAWANR